jgi:hypothetical protein
MYYTAQQEIYMEERTALLNVRIEPTVKAAFERMAKEIDRTPSQLLRDAVRDMLHQYARKHAQRDLDLTPKPPPQPAPKKPAKGQKMASMKPANWRKP